jgi:ABC-type phosphate transport system substrate-binding protein
MSAKLRWYHLGSSVLLLGMCAAACSALLDKNKVQCSSDSDCDHFGGHPYCVNSLCVASNLGPEGCFFGSASTDDEFANQCSTATCGSFDNCARLTLCGSDSVSPVAIDPPMPDAASGGTADAPPPATTQCVDPANRNTIVVSGSTAVQPFMQTIAPLLALNSPAYQIAYQPSGSCTGVDFLFNPDPLKRVVKDIAGKQALLFHTDGTSEPCTFGTGVPLDVAVSDVFSTTCNTAYPVTSAFGSYLGPIQPMTFIVPSTSTETSISAEMAHEVFGRGETDTDATPWNDFKLYFIRNSGSGTQQMISRAINVDPKKWWGLDRGSSGAVRDKMEAVTPDKASQAIGIISTDFADAVRSDLRILAFKGTGQTCAYFPDSTEFTHDKDNVRDGHYSIWGPIHFYANVTNGIPSAAAGALVTRFTLPRLDQPLLDAVIKIGFVPDCAMTVSRSEEMGPLSEYSPQFHCGCYFDTTIVGGTTPASCHVCSGPADCAGVAGKPACNNGFCEVR